MTPMQSCTWMFLLLKLWGAQIIESTVPVILGTTVLSMTLDSVCLSVCSSSSWPCP